MFKLQKKEKNVYIYTLTADKAEFEEFVNLAYEHTKGKFNVQGFRKGKAPRKVIEQNYGSEVFYEHAFNDFINKEYREILKADKNINPVADPNVDIKKFSPEDGMEITLTITTVPDVELGAYTGLEVEAVKGEVTEEQVNAELEQVRERQARFVPVDREAKMGDFVVIDFVGRTDGKEFEGGKAEDYRLELGSHSFIDTFEDQIVGMNVGEKRTIKVKFPENYVKELKGKDAEFDVTLNKVEAKELPELNDEFAANASEFDTLADFKADIKKHMEESLENSIKKQNENKLVELVVKNAKVDVPDVMAEEQFNNHLKDFEARLSYQGMSLEDYFNYTNSSLEEFKKSKIEEAREAVKTQLVLNEIIKKENFVVTDADVDEKLQEIATKYKKSLEDYKKSMTEYDINYIKNDILIEKLMNFLKSNNKFN